MRTDTTQSTSSSPHPEDFSDEFRSWLSRGNPGELRGGAKSGQVEISYDQGDLIVVVERLEDHWYGVSYRSVWYVDGRDHFLFSCRTLETVEKLLAVRHGWAVRRYAGHLWIPERTDRDNLAPGVELRELEAVEHIPGRYPWSPAPERVRRREELVLNGVSLVRYLPITTIPLRESAAASWVVIHSVGDIIASLAHPMGLPSFPLDSATPRPGYR